MGNLGGKIVRSLLTGLGARLDVASGVAGTIFTIDVPAASFAEAADSGTPMSAGALETSRTPQIAGD